MHNVDGIVDISIGDRQQQLDHWQLTHRMMQAEEHSIGVRSSPAQHHVSPSGT